jgi:hypothetical protein
VGGKGEDLLPAQRSHYWCCCAAIIGAAQAKRSYHWCGYAASIIGAATTADQQGVRLCGFYYWCCHHGGSAGRHTDLEDVQPFEFLCSFWKSSSSVPPDHRGFYYGCFGAATTADQPGGIQILKMCVPRRISRAAYRS